MTPAHAIRNARERAGHTRAFAAGLIAVDKTSLGNWERGRALPRDLETLGMMADLLAMTRHERQAVALAIVERDLNRGAGSYASVTVIAGMTTGSSDDFDVRVSWHDE